jgi:hypothetical protein
MISVSDYQPHPVLLSATPEIFSELKGNSSHTLNHRMYGHPFRGSLFMFLSILLLHEDWAAYNFGTPTPDTGKLWVKYGNKAFWASFLRNNPCACVRGESTRGKSKPRC